MVKRLIKYYLLKKPLKQIEMNRILDKKSKNIDLTNKEINFHDLYLSNIEDKDYMLLSKNSVHQRITKLLSQNKKIICNLNDRDGKIGLEIIDVSNKIEDENSFMLLKGGVVFNLYDRFLYNIIFNTKRKEYSLQEHDEYFEKLKIKND